MQNIGIIGRKRSGKDTAARFLMDELGYVRHGLADPLKDAALALDPIIDGCTHNITEEFVPDRLSEIVKELGWEEAKDTYPEVRRILQRLGDEAGRQVHGDMTWIHQLMRRVDAANAAGSPVVVPDVRYPNEAEELAHEGFTIVRISRPGFDTPAPGEHASERVEALPVHREIRNDGPLWALYDELSELTDVFTLA